MQINTKPNVLILLATYNGEKWIKSQLNTILNQSEINAHIVVSDDNSTDQTPQIIKSFCKLHPTISIILNKQSSGSAGGNFKRLITNVGADKYQYIAFSDQDDLWANNKIISAINCIKKNYSSGYSSSVLAFWQDGTKKNIKISSNETIADFLFEGGGQGCTFVLPINIFNKIKEFCIKHNEDIEGFYYHDWLIYLLVRSWDGKWFFDQNSSMYYRQHQNNDTGSRGTLLSITKRVEKIRNGWFKNQIAIALKIYFLAANHKNKSIMSFSKVFNEKDSISRRLLITKFVWLHGRRRLSDRLVMVVASILGYI